MADDWKNDVNQDVFERSLSDKLSKLVELLNAEDPAGTVVFVERKKTADFLAVYLSESLELRATTIHGARRQWQRRRALGDFICGTMKVLVATLGATRNLSKCVVFDFSINIFNFFDSYFAPDIPDVQHVINYDLPKNIDDYVHQIGRLGNGGKVSTFYDVVQVYTLHLIRRFFLSNCWSH